MGKISNLRIVGRSGEVQKMIDDDESKEGIGRRLKAARLALGHEKKNAYAEKAGISEQAYGAYENGHREITRDAAKALQRHYDLSLDFIYFGNINALPHRIAKLL